MMNAWMSSVSTTGCDHGGSPCLASRSWTLASSFPTSSNGIRSVMVSPSPLVLETDPLSPRTDVKSTQRSILAQAQRRDQSDQHRYRHDQPRDPVASGAIDNVTEERCRAQRSHAAEEV